MRDLVIVKLGGAAITFKDRPFSIRLHDLERIASELSSALKSGCIDNMVIVHGGGSYGHIVVETYRKMYRRKLELNTNMFVDTVLAMRELNNAVAEVLRYHGLPVIPMDTHSIVYIGIDGVKLYIDTIEKLLNYKLIPLLYGDVVITYSGFNVLSGDDIVAELAIRLKANRIVFVTSVDGIYTRSGNVIEILKYSEIDRVLTSHVSNTSSGVDVTGGMKRKLAAIKRAFQSENLETVYIVSGLVPKRLKSVLCNENAMCTRIVRG